jgi:hypothetical protein
LNEKFPRQHGCWRAWLLSKHEHITSLCQKPNMFPNISYVFQLRSQALASNRAGAWTCEVLECIVVSDKYIITSQVPRQHGCWRAWLLP